jgi:hypothetical protein
VQLFYFVLKTTGQTVPDPEGQELPDRAAAWQHAVAVARQLMHNRESETRGWRIQVCDDYLTPLFDVFFAEVDISLAHIPVHVQASIENVVRTAAALNDTIARMKNTLLVVRQTLGDADRILGSIPGHRP